MASRGIRVTGGDIAVAASIGLVVGLLSLPFDIHPAVVGAMVGVIAGAAVSWWRRRGQPLR